jgi:hypothetical protein
MPLPCEISHIRASDNRIFRGMDVVIADHRYADDVGLIPSYVLHEQSKLSGVEGNIISGLGGIGVTSTIQV